VFSVAILSSFSAATFKARAARDTAGAATFKATVATFKARAATFKARAATFKARAATFKAEENTFKARAATFVARATTFTAEEEPSSSPRIVARAFTHGRDGRANSRSHRRLQAAQPSHIPVHVIRSRPLVALSLLVTSALLAGDSGSSDLVERLLNPGRGNSAKRIFEQAYDKEADGAPLDRRPSDAELRALTKKYDIEWAVTYTRGDGPNGAGGRYYLHRGEDFTVAIPIQGDVIFIAHTHPKGANEFQFVASDADREVMRDYRLEGSPQRVSKIVTEQGLVFTFSETERHIPESGKARVFTSFGSFERFLESGFPVASDTEVQAFERSRREGGDPSSTPFVASSNDLSTRARDAVLSPLTIQRLIQLDRALNEKGLEMGDWGRLLFTRNGDFVLGDGFDIWYRTKKEPRTSFHGYDFHDADLAKLALDFEHASPSVRRYVSGPAFTSWLGSNDELAPPPEQHPRLDPWAIPRFSLKVAGSLLDRVGRDFGRIMKDLGLAGNEFRRTPASKTPGIDEVLDERLAEERPGGEEAP